MCPFFAGLTAFLMPVNVMVAISSVLLVLVGVYFSLAILPLFSLDCPYHTPLSGLPPTSQDSLGEHEACFARPHASRRIEPLGTAVHLFWTVKSLADETELEPLSKEYSIASSLQTTPL
ncbi:hypothetical protein FB451DRAFT_1515982 [Mycena latifolia]|nr:hypothetical protein FB451DRAFT_1515982 [Mycena latifolia]